MINRTVTREKLKALNVRNPYNDLAESFWGYTDLMEATVSHTAEEWHDAKYNDGKYNIIVEKFVDANGKGDRKVCHYGRQRRIRAQGHSGV